MIWSSSREEIYKYTCFFYLIFFISVSIIAFKLSAQFPPTAVTVQRISPI